MIETGTSFLLVPPRKYMPFVRQLVPRFDKHCGVDRKAGNVVVCDCAVRDEDLVGVQIELTDEVGQRHNFKIAPEDLFEEARARDVCVLQVQQRPVSSKTDDPFGLLGAPLLGPGHVGEAGPFGMPLGGPFLMPFAPGPIIGGLPGMAMNHSKAPFKAVSLPDPIKALLKNLTALGNLTDPLNLLPGMTDAGSGSGMPGNGVVTETIVEVLGDGTRCEREVVRDAGGKILRQTTRATRPDGKQLSAHDLTCAGTRVSSTRRLLAGGRGRPGDSIGAAAGDLWVLGDVFLKRHAVIFDFSEERLGVAQPAGAGLTPAAAPGSGSIEVLEGSDTEPPAQAWSAPRHVRAAAAQLMAVAGGSAGAPTSHRLSTPVVMLLAASVVSATVAAARRRGVNGYIQSGGSTVA